MNLTLEDLQQEFPNAKKPVLEAIINGMDIWTQDYEINTPLRMAHFLAQAAHESGGFRLLEENLNYSADGLNKIFPKYFKNAGRDANEYARKPEKIANVVYGGRMGNGDEASGDGFRYCGRGLIQLTGKNNYVNFANYAGISPEDAAEYLETLRGAVHSGCWFWYSNDLNTFADAGDFVGMTKRINGGTIGLDDRIKHYNEAVHIFGA